MATWGLCRILEKPQERNGACRCFTAIDHYSSIVAGGISNELGSRAWDDARGGCIPILATFTDQLPYSIEVVLQIMICRSPQHATHGQRHCFALRGAGSCRFCAVDSDCCCVHRSVPFGSVGADRVASYRNGSGIGTDCKPARKKNPQAVTMAGHLLYWQTAANVTGL